MTKRARHRYTLHSMDDAGCAVLKREDGLTFPVPTHWLPDDVQPGQRLEVQTEGAGAELILRIVVRTTSGQ